MDKLSEELLDHIISYLTVPHYDRYIPDIEALRNMSKLSHQLKRIAEPHLHRIIDFNRLLPNESQRHQKSILPRRQYLLTSWGFMRTLAPIFSSQSRVSTTTPEHDPISIYAIPIWAVRHAREALIRETRYTRISTIIHTLNTLPNLQILDVTHNFRRLDDSWIEMVKVGSLRSVYIRQFQPAPVDEYTGTAWEFTNANVRKLHLELVGPDDSWEYCESLTKIAPIFPALTSLHLRPRIGGWGCDMSPALYRHFVFLWRNQFATTLRHLSFLQTERRLVHMYLNTDAEEFDNTELDHQKVLQDSRLETLKLDTNCLLAGEEADRSTFLDLSILPATLRTLYLRHVVFRDGTGKPTDLTSDLRTQEEMSCLLRLFVELRKLSNFPDLEKVTLALFMPPELVNVTVGIVREGTSRIQVPLDLVLG
jgi:hypothetical protein